MSTITQQALSTSGRQKIDWVKNYMPVLAELEREYAPKQIFAGKKIAVCIHLEAKTAYLCEVLTEFNVFDEDRRSMLLRLQVPVSFRKNSP